MKMVLKETAEREEEGLELLDLKLEFAFGLFVDDNAADEVPGGKIKAPFGIFPFPGLETSMPLPPPLPPPPLLLLLFVVFVIFSNKKIFQQTLC